MEISKTGITSIIFGLILIVVIISVIGSLTPTLQDAGDALNDSNQCAARGCYWNLTGANTSLCEVDDATISLCTDEAPIPFSGLFAGSGILILVLIAGVFLYIFYALKFKK